MVQDFLRGHLEDVLSCVVEIVGGAWEKADAMAFPVIPFAEPGWEGATWVKWLELLPLTLGGPRW